MDITWLTTRDLVAMHNMLIHREGGLPGLRDEALLESSLARPRNKFEYGEMDIAALAAAYGFGLTKNHCFVDGNKRTAFASMEVFIGKNWAHLQALETHKRHMPRADYYLDAPSAEVVLLMVDLATDAMSESELAEWVSAHIAKEE